MTGSLGSFTRDEQWTLSRTGNWASRFLDLNGDGDSDDADEFTDAGSFNRANELTQRALSGGVSATCSGTRDRRWRGERRGGALRAGRWDARPTYCSGEGQPLPGPALEERGARGGPGGAWRGRHASQGRRARTCRGGVGVR
ncbi:MAG: hypothetical protein FJ255_12715, partial [Phycisphaerae bacterium]|nr:hypothetical protein [Phycisphaerae bacterium]